jgi:hypothetical protein
MILKIARQKKRTAAASALYQQLANEEQQQFPMRSKWHPKANEQFPGGHMGLMDAWKKAEQQGRKAVRWGAEQAMVSLDDAERAIRRRMRIYPQQVAVTTKSNSVPASVAPAASPAAAAAAPAPAPSADIPAEDSEIEGRKIA